MIIDHDLLKQDEWIYIGVIGEKIIPSKM
jgi:hypothetical protein